MLHIICALKHEARPLVEHFQLIHDGGSKEFITYGNQVSGLSLTVTGTGLDAAAHGTAFVIAYHNAGVNDAWLNIGIAGHASLPVGTPVLVTRVLSQDDNRTWMPVINFPHDLDTSDLLTVSQTVSEYARGRMYDMEAAGFFQEASASGTPDRVHCLKIISDNRDHPAENVSAVMVRQLITQNLRAIEFVINKLKQIIQL